MLIDQCLVKISEAASRQQTGGDTETHSQTFCWESKLKVSIEFLPQSKEDPEEEGAIDSKSQDEGHQENSGLLIQLSRAHMGSETEAAWTGLAWVCSRSSVYALPLAQCFCGTPNRGSECIWLFPALGTFSLLLHTLSCPASVWELPCLTWLSLGGLLFSEGGVDG